MDLNRTIEHGNYCEPMRGTETHMRSAQYPICPRHNLQKKDEEKRSVHSDVLEHKYVTGAQFNAHFDYQAKGAEGDEICLRHKYLSGVSEHGRNGSSINDGWECVQMGNGVAPMCVVVKDVKADLKNDDEIWLDAVGTPGNDDVFSVQNFGDIPLENKANLSVTTTFNHVGEDGGFSVIDNTSFKASNQKNVKNKVVETCLQMATKVQSMKTPSCQHILTWFYFVVLLSLSIGLVIALLNYGDGTSDVSNQVSTPTPSEDDIYLNETWFYTREDWYAMPPKNTRKLKLPIEYVIIGHTQTTMVCSYYYMCVIYLRLMQSIHMNSKEMEDITYNYIISSGPNGEVYTGRGANIEGEHTVGCNTNSLGIGFVGNYDKRLPNARQVAHVQSIIAEALRLGKLSERYKLVGQNQVSGLASPGKYLALEIKNWPHYVENP